MTPKTRRLLNRPALAVILLATAAIVAAPHARAANGGLVPPPTEAMKKYGKQKPVASSDSGKRDPNAKMLMEAKELVYDYDKEIVTAVGGVDIYYDGRALQAERVRYDQKSNRVLAVGKVKMTERNGDVIYADQMDVTDDFRDGFLEPLRLETTQRTHFAAAKARREDGKLMVFDRGVYTACEPCRDNPDKPPLWQIRSKRIIWRQDEKMIYYENATFELFGYPIAWLPFFSSPDPSVTRKTGLLGINVIRSRDVGYGVETPYYWVLSPTSDLTLAPVFTQHQGVMLKGEYRQKLIDGAYSIRAAGINQLNSNRFDSRVESGNDAGLRIGPGNKDDRWALSTEGRFDINERWSWGWDVNLLSDKWVRGDYDLWGTGQEAVSQIYLQGEGDRSYFEARAYKFYGLTRFDQSDRQALAAPVIDYDYTFEDPVAGGELAFTFNATNTYRSDSDYAKERTRLSPRPDNALIGVAGTYARMSGEFDWRRRFVDPIGQVWTPFAFVRGDLIYTKPDFDSSTSAFLNHDQDVLARGMAGVGLEYRYPFVAVTEGATHQIEPIAQLILRPNETQVGRLPNEDAQSLLFDDTTLFSWNKFSGYDRIEGGSRANIGGQYTITADTGASASVLVGQSFALFGQNPFDKITDPTRIGPNSGLDRDRSDYVAGATYVPNSVFSLASHFRFDEKTLNVRMAEVEGRAQFERFQANLIYGRYDKAPFQGFDDIRQGVLGGTRVFVTKDFYVEGGARYNIERAAFDRTQLGFGLNDIAQCLSFNFTYIREIDTNADTVRVSDVNNKFLVKLDFRTLGSVSASRSSRSSVNPDSFSP